MANDVHNDVHTGPESGTLTELVTGIVNDLQELFKQQMTLLKHEVHEDLRKTVAAVSACAAGGAVTVVGAFLLGFGLVHLLTWASEMPLWVSFLIFAGVFLLTGAVLVYAGAHKFTTFNPLPEESAEALKENVQWIMKPK